jgi:hypothetical protein
MTPLWTCPDCGNLFVKRNHPHSCVSLPLETHFENRPHARQLFDTFRAAVEAEGPVVLVSSKTRIGFMTRVRFAGARVLKDRLRLQFWLKRRQESPRMHRIEFIPPDNWIHYLEVRVPSDIDEEVRELIRESRAIGDQEHLRDRERFRHPPRARA